jgi:nucleoside-diphosphate-sugar epimerase
MNTETLNAAPLKAVPELIYQMTTPSPEITRLISKINNKILILGVGGKMGPTLAELIRRAGGEVIGVDIFPDKKVQQYLDQIGVPTICADLTDPTQLGKLPEAEHIILMAGTKFGSSHHESFTWMMNSFLPGKIIERFPKSQIVYISSGNVYKFVNTSGRGAVETAEVEPVGEYAMSRLGGERLVQYFSEKNQTPACIVRLFYATELRYGIMHDIASKIKKQEPIDLTMGYFNQIWQGDANAYILKCFSLCQTPAKIINLTGPDVLSVREIAIQLGKRMNIEPNFQGTENATALLGDATAIFNLFGKPNVAPHQMLDWVAWWIMNAGETLGKPTKFERRDGKF